MLINIKVEKYEISGIDSLMHLQKVSGYALKWVVPMNSIKFGLECSSITEFDAEIEQACYNLSS